MKRSLLFISLCMAAIVCVAQPRPPRGHHGHDNGGRHRTEWVNCATSEQIMMVKKVLNDQSFDDKKLEVAKLCVTLGEFCVSDLAVIAECFSFDDRRLEFFKYAYHYCVDPQNYPMLRDSFAFKTNYDALLDYIYPDRNTHR